MSLDNRATITEDLQVAIIVSEFNAPITDKLLEGALEQLAHYQIKDKNIAVFKVPGAVEIPLIAKLLAKKKQHHAIVAVGAVVRGETTHYDYVCSQASQGCQQVMLEFEVPVIFGVLTTENAAQAQARVGGSHGHKGKDAVDSAIAMAKLVEKINRYD